jgi:hypothetical protein
MNASSTLPIDVTIAGEDAEVYRLLRGFEQLAEDHRRRLHEIEPAQRGEAQREYGGARPHRAIRQPFQVAFAFEGRDEPKSSRHRQSRKRHDFR